MRIAVTGGVCDGKSTVLAMLSELGFPCFSADAIVAEAYSDSSFVQKLTALVGNEVVRGGQVDRRVLLERLLGDDKLRRDLNRLVHPIAMAKLLEEMPAGGETHSFAEVPLLIETATQGWFDRVWVVAAGLDAQMSRLTERFGGDSCLAAQVLGLQLPTEVKAAFGHAIIRTNLPHSRVKDYICELAQQLC